MKTVRVTVRISDGETKQYLNTEEYVITVKDPDNYEELFDVLFKEYPEDFPSEDPGVDAEIVEVEEM